MCSIFKFSNSLIRKPAEYNNAKMARCFKFLVQRNKLMVSSCDSTEGSIFDFLGRANSKLLIWVCGQKTINNFKALINWRCVLMEYLRLINTVSIKSSTSLLLNEWRALWLLKSIKSAIKKQ